VGANGTITNTGNTIVLKSSVPVTWRVTDQSGNSTNKASVTAINSTTAYVTGYENGVVNVIATSTDGNNSQGNLNVNITNQPVVTVVDQNGFNNAVASGAQVIKLLGIGGTYNFANLNNLLTSNSAKSLTIIGQDQTSVINVATGNPTFATVDGSSLVNLNLKNLTIRGVTGNSLSNVIQVNGGTLTLNGVYFDGLGASGSGAVGVNQTGGTVTINNSQFLTSNSFTNAVVINNGAVTNSVFTGNSSFAGELGAIQASGNVSIQGNRVTNYIQATSGQPSEYAISLSSGFNVSNVGGSNQNNWNTINNSNIGILVHGVTDPNVQTADKNTLNSYNSIDVTNTNPPIQIQAN
jgi:hypothetical protein